MKKRSHREPKSYTMFEGFGSQVGIYFSPTEVVNFGVKEGYLRTVELHGDFFSDIPFKWFGNEVIEAARKEAQVPGSGLTIILRDHLLFLAIMFRNDDDERDPYTIVNFLKIFILLRFNHQYIRCGW